MNQIRPLRLIFKIVSLFILANLLYATLQPPVGRISAYNHLFSGRLRFPFGDGLKEANITIDDLDAMFASHVISAPKRTGEFRVIVLGDSSVWGTVVRAHETLPAQLDKAGSTCSSKDMRFYNLGYPHPSVMQDLLILDRAMSYQPDMVVWMVTLNSLRKRPMNTFLLNNLEEVLALESRFDLGADHRSLRPKEKTFLERTLIGEREELARLLMLQSLGITWSGTGLDVGVEAVFHELPNDMQGSYAFAGFEQAVDLSPLLMLDYLEAGVRLGEGIPMLFVNEPIFIASGTGSEVRYSVMYPRWAYDQYRELIQQAAFENEWNYLDAWDSIPPEYFVDTPLHITATGEAMLADEILPSVEQIACH